MTADPNPYEASTTSDTPPPIVDKKSARNELLPVALALLVLPILHIMVGLMFFTFVFNLVNSPDADAESKRQMTLNCMYYGVSMVYCLVLITGGFSMMRRGSYMWAMATCILPLIPIFGPCYVLGIPFGVWGILILRKPHVRESFASM